MKRRLICLTLLFALSSSLSGFELPDSRSGGLGRSALLSYPTACNVVNISGDGMAEGAWQTDAGYNRRFELADLDHLFVAAATRYRQLTFALGASQFGRTDLYAEQLLKGSLAYRYRRFTLGAALSALQIQIGNGYGSLRAATFGFGISLASDDFRVSFVADNLTRPRLVDNGTRIDPAYTLSTEYCGNRAFSLVGSLKAEPTQKPQFGLGQWIDLSRQAAFFWGVAGAPLEYGGGLEIDVPFGAVIYAATVHPVLGMTHTITLSYRSRHRKHSGEGDFD